ncbi:MAG TPA: Ldh family oxidoreductase [Casimicrobiaceae bacterium]|nr:Ldh family oxidoreductase [Casimicrobiaceae bacterium]
MQPPRYAAPELVAFANGLLRRVGVRDDIAATVADVLVTGDLLGHTTHGLGLLAPYLGELEKGTMTATGEPRVQNARPAAELWDGGRLPGPWLTMRAMDATMAMARTHGSGTVVIRRSHHIACLAAYLLHATEQGMVGIVQSSDPILAAVVPHGGITPIVTPNPIAIGIPTSGDPILVDVSTSITSMGFIRQRRDAGERLPGPWVIDAEGHATDDPNVVFADPKGALLPLGGLDAGYKGFGLALMIEALTAGLAGAGRADPPEGWGATVFVQAIDPAAFGGDAGFRRQMDRMVEASHASRPRPGVDRVRVPGEAGMRRLREQRQLGVALYPSILPALLPWSAKLGVAPPPVVG